MIKDLQKILKEVHEPDEYKLIVHNMVHPLYWIWKLENGKLKDLSKFIRPYRNEHARFDIFINGQYILEKDYIAEHIGKDFHIKFLKSNFVGAYDLEITDDIKLEGDIDLV